MARLDDVRKLRREIGLAAGRRWLERLPERQEALLKAARFGPAGADTPERVQAFRDRMKFRSTGSTRSELVQERIIGPTLDFTDRPPDSASRQAGRPVGRVVEIKGKGTQPEGFGTGFMIAPGLMLTNHHVLPSKRDTAGIGINFGYERGVDGINEGEIFELAPDDLFFNDEQLDFAVVAVKGASLTGDTLEKFGFHKLIGQTGKVLIGQPINIIQHPEGGPKKYAVSENKLLDVLESYLHYQTDTLPGSSGSPTFSQLWEVVSLHHSGVPEMRDGRILDRRGRFWDGNSQSDDEINWIANEGVRISRILNFLQSVALPSAKQQTLLGAIFSTSPSPIVGQSAEAAGEGMFSTLPIASGATMSAANSSAIITVTGNTTINIGGGVPGASAPAQAQESRAQEKKMVFDPDYGNRSGYQSDFLRGHSVDLPSVAPARRREIYNDRYGKPLVLDYHHYSLVMNKKRRLQMWSAANVDYSPKMKPGVSRKDLGTDTWIADPRIPESLQLADAEFYGPAKKFDRGHIVRREDGAWGATRQEISYANADTFHWTNCTPQHESFNRSNLNGLWGRLENHITEQAPAAGERYIIFAGPVLDNTNDLVHNWGEGEVQIPLEFWKVIVVAEDDGSSNGTLRAYGFMLEQSSTIKKHGLEAFDAGEFAPFQRSLQVITRASGVVFGRELVAADVLAGTDRQESSKRRIEKLQDVVLKRSRARRG